MKLIHYAGETLLTGDALAEAVLRYASALSAKEDSATLTIPTRLPDGAISSAIMLIGPASQLVAVPQDSEFDEVVDEELLAQIEQETARLSTSHPQVDIRATDHESEGTPAPWEI